MADVDIQIGGSANKAEAEIVKLEKRLDKLETKLRNQARTSRRTSKDSSDGFTSWATRVAGVTAAVGTLQQSLRAVGEENKALQDGVSQTIGKLNEAQLKLQIQAGFTPAALEQRIPQIQRSLLQTPTTDFSGGLALSTQLVSSGFKQEDVDSGEALQTVLDLKAATNQFGREMGDVAESVKSVAQFVKAQGIDQPSAAQVRKTGGALTQLFEGSDIQFVDLGDLAGQAATLKSLGISEEIQLAAFSALRDVKTAPEAATGFRQVASRLRGAGDSDQKVQALGEIGLTPDDIDFIGEDFPTALERLKEALSKVDEKKASSVLLTLFGEKGQSAGSVLLGKTGLIRKREGILQGDAFERNVELFQDSRFAENQRVALRKEFAERRIDIQQGGLTFEEARNQLETRRAEGAVGAGTGDRFANSASAAAERFSLWLGEQFGLSPEESLGNLRGRGFVNRASAPPSADPERRGAVERQVELQEQQNEFLREIRDQGDRKQFNREAQRE